MSQPAKKQRIVIDTSVWLMACARQTVGDKMSKADRQIKEASRTQDPKKFRGLLARLLVNYEVIVPEQVRNELEHICKSGRVDREFGPDAGNLGKIVSPENVQDLTMIVDAMNGLTTPARPTKEHVDRQLAMLRAIKENPKQAERWNKKFAPLEGRAVRAVRETDEVAHLPVEPWLELREHLDNLLEKREKDPLNRQLQANIERTQHELKEEWPTLIPDYEILLVAEAASAKVVTRDRDYELMWMSAPSLAKKSELKPMVFQTLDDSNEKDASIQDLSCKIQGNVKPQPKTKDAPDIR